MHTSDPSDPIVKEDPSGQMQKSPELASPAGQPFMHRKVPSLIGTWREIREIELRRRVETECHRGSISKICCSRIKKWKFISNKGNAERDYRYVLALEAGFGVIGLVTPVAGFVTLDLTGARFVLDQAGLTGDPGTSSDDSQIADHHLGQ